MVMIFAVLKTRKIPLVVSFYSSFLWLLLFVLFQQANVAAIDNDDKLSNGLVSIHRFVNNDFELNSSSCTYAGSIVIGGPSSLDQNDTYYKKSSEQLSAISMTVDFINRNRCGIQLTDGNYSIQVRTIDDESSKETTIAIGESLVQKNSNVDILFGGYSSKLTASLAAVATDNKRLLLAPGAASTSVFENRPTVFGPLPPASNYMKEAMEALASLGAKSIATIWEDDVFPKSVCNSVPEYAERLGIEVLSMEQVTASPNFDDLAPYVNKFKKTNPDIVLTCVYKACKDWVRALKSENWAPKAQVFTVCLDEDFTDAVGQDAEFIMGVTPWSPTMKAIDETTGWSAMDFADRFGKRKDSSDVSYQAAMAAATVTILVKAIETADSINVDAATLSTIFSEMKLKTVGGEISFDSNGQSLSPSLLIQYNKEGSIETVYPKNKSSGNITYPMPSWGQRDCYHLSQCENCASDGTCICENNTTISVGEGKYASCMDNVCDRFDFEIGIDGYICVQRNYQELTLKVLVLGYVIVAISFTLNLCFLFWIFRNRRKNIVRVSQSRFLYLICFGAMLSTSALIPWSLSIRGKGEDPDTVSTSCTSIAILWTIGWVLLYSSLCAKSLRLYRVMRNERIGKQEIVTFFSVLRIVILALCVGIAFVVSLTLINPLVLKSYEYGKEVDMDIEVPIKTSTSHAQCSVKDNDGPVWLIFGPIIGFILLLIVINIFLLAKLQNMCADQYQEFKYISFSTIFAIEIAIVGIPLIVNFQHNVTATYMLVVGIVGLHDIGFLCFTFLPKIYFQIYESKNKKDHNDAAILASMENAVVSQWNDALHAIDDILRPGSNIYEHMSAEQFEQLSSIKPLLIQGMREETDDKTNHIPSSLLKFMNRGKAMSNAFIKNETQYDKNSIRYVLNEYGGIRLDLACGFSTSQSHTSNGTGNHDEFKKTGGDDEHINSHFYVLPEYGALDDSQKKSLFRLLSWSSLKQWHFNVFDIAQVTDENPLLFIGWAIMGSPHAQYSMARACGQKDATLDEFQGYNFAQSSLKIPIEKLCDYLRVIENDYLDNPYHNRVHAADVLQSLHTLIQMKGSAFECTEDELFAVLLAAAVHDVNHPGTNNSFHINAKTDIALMYNDKAVLEQKHAAHAFMRMLGSDPSRHHSGERHDELNVLCNLSRQKFALIRNKIIDAVLATDMSEHFKTVAATKSLILSRNKNDGNNNDYSWNILKYMMHLSDISNPTKASPLFINWADRIVEEFFNQGDKESEMGIPISLLCDRHTTKMADSQIGFISFVVRESFEVLALAVPEVTERIMPTLERNMKYWTNEKEKASQILK